MPKRTSVAQKMKKEADKAKAKRIARDDELYRQVDREANSEVAANNDKEEADRRRKAIAQKTRRQDPVIRTPEKIRDAEAHFSHRQNIVFKTAETERNALAHSKKRLTITGSFENLLDTYLKRIRQAPRFICSCCGGLWYEESTTRTSILALEQLGVSSDFIEAILNVQQEDHRLCGTCKSSIKNKRIPKLALSNGFDFPTVPDALTDLSSLEERLVAARIPFMQIRAVGSERQSILKGNVVNVENDLDVCAQVLPRSFDQTSTVQVQLMRRMRYRVPYIYETIRPKKVYDAAHCLLQSELYQEEGITLSDDWSRCREEETLRFICDGETETENELDEAI